MAKWDNVEHGNAATYRSSYYACRCDACTQANTDRSRKERAARRAKGLPEGDERHGTITGYRTWGCRCGACSFAGSKSNKDYSERAKRDAGS